MNEQRSERLKPIVQLTDYREKSSAVALSKTKGAHLFLEKRLKELLNYRENYMLLLQRKAEQGIGGAEFCRYQKFLQQLDSAVAQQKNSIEQSLKNLQQKTNGWKNKRQKKQVMRKVVSHIKKEEQQIVQKKQQKEFDDHTSQRFFNTEKLF